MKPKPGRKGRLISESGTWLGGVAMGSPAGLDKRLIGPQDGPQVGKELPA